MSPISICIDGITIIAHTQTNKPFFGIIDTFPFVVSFAIPFVVSFAIPFVVSFAIPFVVSS